MLCMNEKNIKRGYNFPKKLVAAWEEFHRPSKDYSPSAAGAFLVWMALPADIREKARQATLEPNIKKAVQAIAKDLSEGMVTEDLKELLARLEKAYGTLPAKHS